MAPAPTPKKTGTTRNASPKTKAAAPALKHCGHCGRDLPATEENFAPRKTTKDGLCIYCRECNTSAALKAWAIDHPRQPKAEAVAKAARVPAPVAEADSTF